MGGDDSDSYRDQDNFNDDSDEGRDLGKGDKLSVDLNDLEDN